MSAKEMFEKLGYFEASLPDSKDELAYNFKKSDIEDYRYIAFDKIDKYIELYDKTKDFKLSLEELQAINKQVEELGWNDTTVNTNVELDSKKVIEVLGWNE